MYRGCGRPIGVQIGPMRLAGGPGNHLALKLIGSLLIKLHPTFQLFSVSILPCYQFVRAYMRFPSNKNHKVRFVQRPITDLFVGQSKAYLRRLRLLLEVLHGSEFVGVILLSCSLHVQQRNRIAAMSLFKVVFDRPFYEIGMQADVIALLFFSARSVQFSGVFLLTPVEPC